MINCVILSGAIKRVEVNTKPTRKGPAAVILLQFGPVRQRNPDQQVQFMHAALVRIPPYLYEKYKEELVPDRWVDVYAHLQGVHKQTLSDGFVNNEVVADRLQFEVGEGTDDDDSDSEIGVPAAALATS